MKQNLTRYFPAVSSYTPAKDGAAQEGQKVGATGKRTEIYRAWFSGPCIWLDSQSISYNLVLTGTLRGRQDDAHFKEEETEALQD